MEEEIPFKMGTKIYQTFLILSDKNWHCGKHELPGTQPAKAIQIIRNHGFNIENATMYCGVCKEKTFHRRLIELKPAKDSIARLSIPKTLRNRVMRLYDYTEAITLRKLSPEQLEIDHRFPQVRWSQRESLDLDMSDQEIYRRFQLLTREHNLWKSRYCERCRKTGERGTFAGINFFSEGGLEWDPEIPEDDERGCYGCFWYNPYAWRDKLNDIIAKFLKERS
jgi:hypothetical protein